MKSSILTTEFLISLGIVSWAPIKKGYYPWPPMVVRAAIAWSIISLVAAFEERFALLLGTGFLLAQLVKVSTGSGTIPDWIYKDMTTGPNNSGTPFTAFGMKFDGSTGVAS